LQETVENFRRLPKEFIKIGSPMEYPIFDKKGNLLIPEGLLVKSEDELEKLYERGLYLDIESSQKIGLINKRDAAGYVNDDVKDENEHNPSSVIVTSFPFQTLKVGEIFQLSQQGDFADSTKYNVKYIGGVDKKSIICTVPSVNDKTLYIKEFSGFSVQFFSGKNIYRFVTVVDAVFSRPYPHMHLMFPKELTVNRLRKNQRINVSIIASIKNLTPGSRFDEIQSGKFVDLSLGGSMVESNKAGLQEGDAIECSFKVNLEEQDVLLVVKGFIRSVSTTQSANGKTHYRYGLQFDVIPFQEKIVLQNYIFKYLSTENTD
jgi:c-di-GMP-binding flagellar brake protein YcgR